MQAPGTQIANLRPATREDLESLPDDVIGEIIDGTLYTSPRPRSLHTRVMSEVHSVVHSAYDAARSGPGGWWIQVEPGIVLPGAPELVPDVAGWRRPSLPTLPDLMDRVPNWVCEILSPSTRWLDLKKKRPYYASIGVEYMWLIDPATQTLTISKNTNGQWTELGSYVADEKIRAEPFDGIEIDLSSWWRMTA